MPKQIEHETYYRIPEAARLLGVSRMTLHRWITGKTRVPGIPLRVLRDPISRHYYVAEESVTRLASRFRSQ